MRRLQILIGVLISITMFAGCGSELAAGGAGIAGGFAASETLKGLQADLDRREQSLIAHYNELVDAGAKADDLEEVKQQIYDTVLLRQGSQTASLAVGTDWSDPAAAGGAVATIVALAYGLLNRKKLTAVGQAIKTIRAGSDEATKQSIDKIILEKKAVV